MHQREHEGRPRRHQTAVVNAALCDHAVEWCHDALVGLLLLENSNLGFLGGDIRLSHSHRRLLRLQGKAIIIALLTRQPSPTDQIAVAGIGDLREIAARLRLLQCRLVLGKRRPGLCNLMIKFRRGNVRQ